MAINIENWLEADRNKIQTLCPKRFWPAHLNISNCYDALYAHFRYLPQPVEMVEQEQAQAFIEACQSSQNNMVPEQRDAWRSNGAMLRIPKLLSGPDVNRTGVSRLLLDVRPDPALLSELDKFCHDHKAYYKIHLNQPASGLSPQEKLRPFADRKDPVIIYLLNEETPETLRKISEIAGRYLREGFEERELPGKRIAAGVSLGKILPFRSRDPLRERAQKLAPELATLIGQITQLGVSEGMQAACDKMLGLAEDYERRVDSQQQGMLFSSPSDRPR